ncbi:MAG: arginyltransferase [Proteobacteria bacterium]|nr:arginyltransferase [Pseudomonadota bacterium]MDA1302346.1 arginyltransferase [Pseudomonadota bacterium]
MTSLSELRFFTTPEHDCSYLDGRRATTLFADPAANIDTALYSTLSAVGFRRSGAHIYRPYCEACTACVPVRVPVASFKLRRRHKRVQARNQDVVVVQAAPSLKPEYFELYQHYINTRHADGDMFPANLNQFESFLVNGRPEATFYEFREQQHLLAVAVADQLADGLSAIYTFFDPDDTGRSLGVYAVLWLIEETRRREFDHLYLGYWIKECQKMSYKMDYKPLELFVNNRWIPLSR